MEKFFTNHSKCSLAIIPAITALISAFSANAEEYKPMIRYDRVWECYSTCDGKDYNTYKCMRFDGTEEINGKIYHRLVTFKKRLMGYDQEKGAIVKEMMDCYEHEGYLREEDGKVFTLIEGTDDSFTDAWGTMSGCLYIPTDSYPENKGCGEYLLYDFNMEENQIYDAISFVTGGAWNNRFAVLNVSYVEIDGEECKMMYVCSEDQLEYYETYDTPYSYYPGIVEGIGAIEYGCLNYHEFMDHLTRLYAHNYFTCLYDLDGNVIYPTDPEYLGYDYGSFASVKDMTDDTVEITAPLYDILGRRIANPAPGQLYIQGGKKHIAR
ncbi:MAG: hypothetical protein HDS39_05360 [Bacteroides sp.]|nr:hypothetical protein [Bacteroides sp.]